MTALVTNDRNFDYCQLTVGDQPMSKKSLAESTAALAAAGAPAIKTTRKRALPAVAAPDAGPTGAIGEGLAALTSSGEPAAAGAGLQTLELALDQLRPSPLNPRRSIDMAELEPLARSIADNGLLQPILARGPTDEPGPYEIICGARRHAAALLARENSWIAADWTMPTRVRQCSDAELVLLAATENLARADMHPLDEAAVFAAMRPHVEAQDGMTTEAAIGKALGVSERTVFRRLQLLRCSPEVQDALRAKRISLQHAQAYSMGETERQREVLVGQLAGDKNQWDEPMRAADVRYELVNEDSPGAIPVGEALFDPALYAGAIVEDAETEERFFTDRGEFERLQRQALQPRVDELLRTWKWVDIDLDGYGRDWTWYGISNADEAAGAVVCVRHGKVDIHAPAIRDSVIEERRRQSNRDRNQLAEDVGLRSTSSAGSTAGSASTSPGTAKPPAPRPPLSAAQIETLHAAKTRALRRAVASRATHDGRVPIALSCLGMLGAREVRGLTEASYAGYGNRVIAVGSLLAETSALDHLLKTVALEIPDKFKKADLGYCGLDGEAPAAWFGALMSLPTQDLYELHARLISERVGSWIAPPHEAKTARLGDSPLAAAIAVYSAAEEHLVDLWKPDRDYFAGYGKDRLIAIARDQLRLRNPERLNKTALIDACVEECKTGFWKAALFPEAQFQTEAEAETALAAPLPVTPAAAAE